MSTITKIEWCDRTFNPWIGCTHKSPGCIHCYAEGRDKRFAGGKHWGKGEPRERTSEKNWKLPRLWNATAICANCGYAELIGSDDCRKCRRNFDPATRRRPRVFCASLADWLDEEVPIGWFADLLALINATLNLDWLLLTKRPENWSERLHAAFREDSSGDLDYVSWWLDGDAPGNVWIGTSVEDQKRADERIPLLTKIPARIRFLSCEPLLGPIDLRSKYVDDGWSASRCELHWVIVGGESGPGARPCNIDWIRSIVDQGKSAGVPVFVKQLGKRPISGEVSPTGKFRTNPHSGKRQIQFAVNALNLRDDKGGDPSEWPDDLRIREFPKPREAATA